MLRFTGAALAAITAGTLVRFSVSRTDAWSWCQNQRLRTRQQGQSKITGPPSGSEERSLRRLAIFTGPAQSTPGVRSIRTAWQAGSSSGWSLRSSVLPQKNSGAKSNTASLAKFKHFRPSAPRHTQWTSQITHRFNGSRGLHPHAVPCIDSGKACLLTERAKFRLFRFGRIGRSTLATAGHCVHAGNNSPAGWSTNLLFCPSYGPAGVHPARGCWTGVTQVVSFNGSMRRISTVTTPAL